MTENSMNTDETGRKQRKLFEVEVEVRRETKELHFRLVERENGEVIAERIEDCSSYVTVMLALECGAKLVCRHAKGLLVAITPSGNEYRLAPPPGLKELDAHGLTLEYYQARPEELARFLSSFRAAARDEPSPMAVIPPPEPVSPPPSAKRFVCQGFLKGETWAKSKF